MAMISIECCLGAQRHRRLIRPSPFSIPQIAGQGAGRASRALPRYRLPGRFAGVLPAAREESQRLSGADFPDEDFWTIIGKADSPIGGCSGLLTKLGSEQESEQPLISWGILILGTSGYSQRGARQRLDQTAGVARLPRIPARDR